MAILTVKQYEDEAGDASSEGKVVPDAARRFYVTTDSGSHTTGDILQAGGIPQLGDSHPVNGSFVLRRNAERIGTSFNWMVTVDYGVENTSSSSGGDDPNNDPELNKPVFRWNNTQKTTYKDRDANGAQLTNSAGDEFEDGDAVDEYYPTFTITNFRVLFEVITPALIRQYSGAVHAGAFDAIFTQKPQPENLQQQQPPFFTFGDYVVRLTNFDAGTTVITKPNGLKISEWDCSLTFTVSDSWLGTAIDRGYYSATVTASKGFIANITDRLPILDDNNIPVKRPVLLNGVVGEGNGKLANGSPFYRVWRKYPHTNLNNLLTALGLPTTLAGYKVEVSG